MDDRPRGADPSPINPLPLAVVALFLPLAAVEIVLSAGGAGLAGGAGAVGWRIAAVTDWGLSAGIVELILRGDLAPDLTVRVLTYPFVHASFTHAAFAGALLLALGKFVGEIVSGWKVVAIFFVSSSFGALVYGVALSGPYPLIGAYPAVYGLIGAFTAIAWLRARAMGTRQIAAFQLIGVLLAIQLIFGALLGADPTWVADVAGFVAGFVAMILLIPGGAAAILRRLRAG
ncbi:MAG: rhomboid family intramembrane serine protease [Paracoccaceae bacterium]